MAEAVREVLANSHRLLIESPTGTGKTLAYLVPAVESGQRIVVSTGTKALQDQILKHDIPVLEQLVSKPFSVQVLKGVANYVCKRKLNAYAAAQGSLLPGTACVPRNRPTR